MKANHNKQGQLIIGIPSRWYRKDTPNQVTDMYDVSFKEADYIYDEWVPVIYPEVKENQKLGSVKEIKDGKGKLTQVTYHVVDKSLEELKAEILSNSQNLKSELIQRLMEDEIVGKAQALPDDEAMQNQAIYPFWEEGVEAKEGNKFQRIVGLEIQLFKVKVGKTHTTQANWTPENEQSLFTRVGFKDQAVPWSSTAASAGEYTFGYIVTHKGKTWKSIFQGANAWAPGEYGWEELIN